MKRLAILAAFLAVLAGLARAAGADALADLVEKYKATTGRTDDFGFETQRTALNAIADLGTDASRSALRSILNGLRSGERRSLMLVLAAIVKKGVPQDL